MAAVHRILGAIRCGIHVRRRTAHGVACRDRQARSNQDKDRKFPDHDRSFCFSCGTIMAASAAACLAGFD
jgi:hypothetical protein